MPVSVKVNMSVLAFKRKESVLEPADGQAPSHLHASTPDPQSSLILFSSFKSVDHLDFTLL